MEITAFSPSRLTGYGASPVSSVRRSAQALDTQVDKDVRGKAPIEYVVQGEVLEKQRQRAYSNDLLEAMRSMEREFRLNIHADDEPNRSQYAWGAVAAYQHTASNTSPAAARPVPQTIDYYI